MSQKLVDRDGGHIVTASPATPTSQPTKMNSASIQPGLISAQLRRLELPS
ncbi:MAG: hypothetical protein M1587_11555 [Thaumarchaeota archaeon]|nr:hypothetical protein [Nitrososphaerota archaeon]